METLTGIYELANYLGIIDTFFELYGTYIWTTGLILALLNCFFGYKLRKLWGTLFGFLLGAAAGLGVAFYLKHTGSTALLFALAFGISFAILAFLLYRLGLFFLCTGSIVFLLWHLLPFHSKTAQIVYLCLGILTGILTLLKERLTISLTTAISGAWASAWFFSLLTGHKQLILFIFITISLSTLGILLQLKPWKEKKEWEILDEEEKQEEKYKRRHRSQKKKNKKKATRQKQAKRQKKRNTRLKREPETPNYKQKGGNPSPSYPVSQPSPEKQPLNNSDLVDPSTPPAKTDDLIDSNPNINPSDLSEVRKQLSQNIAEIYQEQQETEQI